jgi:hypothetical protein
MSSLNSLSQAIVAPEREPDTMPTAGTEPPTELAQLLRALTRESTAAAATALAREWLGAVQGELLWLPLADDPMASGYEPALARLAQAVVARDGNVSEPDAPGDTLPVWVGAATARSSPSLPAASLPNAGRRPSAAGASSTWPH